VLEYIWGCEKKASDRKQKTNRHTRNFELWGKGVSVEIACCETSLVFAPTGQVTSRRQRVERVVSVSLAWDGMAWDGIGWHGMGCHKMARDGMALHGMAWDSMGWHGMAWHGMG
jgi:hypothetical protein